MRPFPRSRPMSPLWQWLPSHSPSTNLSASQCTSQPQHMDARVVVALKRWTLAPEVVVGARCNSEDVCYHCIIRLY